MPRSRGPLSLSFFSFRSNSGYDLLVKDRVLERVRRLDKKAREKGLASLQPKRDPLIRIGTEQDEAGRVTKNGYGVFHLPWLAEQNPQWPEMIVREVDELRAGIREAHGVGLKYLIWAGMGGSTEDKVFYQSAGLLRRKVRTYILDSADPAKLQAILAHMEKAEKGSLAQALRKCLVVGMAMGMTSYEPVLNLEKLDGIYQKLKISNRSNFIYMTLPGSILDRFASKRGFRRVELQPDGGNATAGRHSGPLTRGSLYPLALNGNDLTAWMRAALLTDSQTGAALQLAGFIQSNAESGRDKVTLFPPQSWKGGAVWTKQNFEESLGKSETIGVKLVIQERLKLVNYWPPKDERQDRCFLVVNVEGERNLDEAKLAALRRARYPLAVLNLSGEAALARYMQFIHYTVFGLACLRNMNFVTQPGVELYKEIAAEIDKQARRRGGIEQTRAWKAFAESDRRIQWRGGLSVSFDSLEALGLLEDADLQAENGNAAAVYARVLERLAGQGRVSYGELTFFGDTRYHGAGRRLRRVLDSAAEAVFRSRMKMAADVYEGPAMNHSYHEMIIGYGRGFSTILLAEKQASIKRVGYTADYHRAQWLATQHALRRRGRAVVGMTVRDLSEKSRQTVKEFFTEVARRLPKRP